jgi:biopolymer transport protein ExbD
MGMNVGSGGPNAVKNDINVTPLIDVLLVLLIIFLVTLPILMKMEQLTVPRKLDEQNEEVQDDVSQLTIRVDADGKMRFCDGNTGTIDVVEATEVAAKLRPKLEALHAGKKVVFVDFVDNVPWGASAQDFGKPNVISTMDAIRSLANDASHDEIKVALKVRDNKPNATKTPCDRDYTAP